MKVTCAQCKKVYTFKKEKLPPYGFSFRCKVCDERIQVSQAQLDDARSDEKAAKKGTKKGAVKLPKLSLPKFRTEKFKKPLSDAGGMVSRLLGRPEGEKLLFLAKYTAYFSVGLLLLAVVLGIFTWFSIGSGRDVTYAEVQRSLELKRDPLLEIQTAVPEIELPGLVRKYVGDDRREDFVEWMNGLQRHQRKDFIKNLETIISQARSLDPQHVQDFITEYQKLKFTRAAVGPIAAYLLKLGLITALLAAVCLLGLFSLLLLELASKKPAPRPATAASKRLRPMRAPLSAKSPNAVKK